MGYAFVLIEGVAFILFGAAVTLTAVFIVAFRDLLAFAWRMWLWGSVGLIIGSAVALGLELYFLTGVGISGVPPRQPESARHIAIALILFGPFVFCSLGITVGCIFGWRLARRRTPAV